MSLRVNNPIYLMLLSKTWVCEVLPFLDPEKLFQPFPEEEMQAAGFFFECAVLLLLEDFFPSSMGKKPHFALNGIVIGSRLVSELFCNKDYWP